MEILELENNCSKKLSGQSQQQNGREREKNQRKRRQNNTIYQYDKQ